MSSAVPARSIWDIDPNEHGYDIPEMAPEVHLRVSYKIKYKCRCFFSRYHYGGFASKSR